MIKKIFENSLKILLVLERIIILLLKGKFITIMLWLIYDYIIFHFSWFFFCNMIIILRERRKISKKKVTEFSFNFN